MKLLRVTSCLVACLAPCWLPFQHSAAQGRTTRPRREAPPQRPASSASSELATAVNELLKLEPLVPEASANAKPNDSAAKDQPPADDAPLEELLAYWLQSHNPGGGPGPSEKVRQRLLEAVEARPWLFNQLIRHLPEDEETAERLYRVYHQALAEDAGWKTPLHNWLVYNSRYFLDMLLQAAQTNDAMLSALARLDWEKAKPLLLTRPPDVFITSLLFKNAMRVGDTALSDQSRQKLQSFVADPSNGEMRILALHALLETEWEGQTEWFASLFADSSLTLIPPASGKESATAKNNALGSDRTASYLADPLAHYTKRLVPGVCQLVGNSNRAVHNAAVDALAQFVSSTPARNEQTTAATSALLPWLSNPAWAEVPQREMLIGALTKLKLPESAPGMLWVLNNDEDDTLRALAAETLGTLKYQPAAPAIRAALEREKDEALRPRLVAALVQCGGFSDEEAAAAIEAFARHLATPAGATQINAIRDSRDVEPLPLLISLGRVLSDDDTLPFPPGVAAQLFERVRALRKTQPLVAKEMLNIVQGVQLPVAFQFLAQRIGEGWLDIAALKLALESAAELRQHASSELYPLLDRGGYAAGIAAVLLGDESQRNAVLQGQDAKAQLALLAAARYLRLALPLDLVAALFNVKTLAPAAESYLIAEDSAAACRLVWARHPGEALILGERLPRRDVTVRGLTSLEALEREARRAVKSTPDLTELLAFYANSDQEKSQMEIRLWSGRAQVRLFTDRVCWRERNLSNSELIELQTWLSQPEVEDLKPETPVGGYTEGFYEFLRLSKNGGRRVVLEGLKATPRNATLHEQLSGLFYRLSKTGEYKTHYAIEAKLPGVEVLHADDRQPILLAGQENGELRVLLGERTVKSADAPVSLEWRVWQQNQLGSRTDAPALFRQVSSLIEENPRGFGIALGLYRNQNIRWPSQLQIMAAAFGPTPASVPTEAAAPPANYQQALITPDGKWIIGNRHDGPRTPLKLLRYNLETKEEFTVLTEPQKLASPVSVLPETGKVLVSSTQSGSFNPAYFLLDPASGALQPVQGDFGPLYDQALRPLQPTGKPAEYWATQADQRSKHSQLGRYNARTFTFTPVLDIPELELQSADVWVDEPRGKVWLTYKGHLLRLNLPAPGK